MKMLKHCSSYLVVVIVLGSVLSGCKFKEDAKRPLDPWVFRSVLDQKPRMVTAALNDNLYVAYDARKCQLYKAWKGGVIFDGAVYTTQHGPQPTSKGYAYYEQPEGEVFWNLVENGNEKEARPRFKGYAFRDGNVYFKYQIEDEQGNAILVEESPDYVSKDNKTGFRRSFRVSNAPSGTSVKIKATLTNLQNENDYETNGDLKVISKSSKQLSGGTVQELKTELVLKNDDETELTVFYHPGFDTSGEETKKEEPVDPIAQGAALIEQSDCKTCHNERVKTIGPAYIDVAKKYENNEGNIKQLVSKIIKGGSGVWGEVPMTAHPDLMEADAVKMTQYIMSLDGEKPAGESKPSVDLTAGTPRIGFSFDDKNEFEKKEDKKDYPGLAVSIFRIEQFMEDFYKIPDLLDPEFTAVAPGIHFSDELMENHDALRQTVFMHFRGYINQEKDENVVFRLVSDDGSRLWIDNKLIVNNDGFHGPEAKDGEMILKKGKHKVEIKYIQGFGGMSLSLQWAKHGDSKFSVVPESVLSHTKADFKKSVKFIPLSKLVRSVPGDRREEAGVHPSFKLSQARPSNFEPRVGGMDFMSDGSMVVCTWDSVGPVYRLEGVQGDDPEKIKVTKIASGLAEPLGIKVVNDTIYVLQKQELTRLIDNDKDGIIDEYQTVSDNWRVSANFHEFAFGLAYKDGYFYAALATAINPGGASTKPQIPDRGKAIKISKKDGTLEFVASGLRTPNGVGFGVDGELFITDNQGDWLPSSKVLHVTPGAWFGSRSVDFEGTATLKEKLPVVWLPQDEVGNSPSQPVPIDVGPYKGQQLHGEVTNGGLKRVFVEKINGQYQGVVFKFSQGLEGGVNRAVWGPDGALYVGQIGNPGNWNHTGGKWFGLQRFAYTGDPTFEMLAVRAKTNGMEIELTEPLADQYGNSITDYEVRQWYYKPTEEYGGPKLDDKALKIKSLNISDDRKRIFLELDGLQPNHVVYIRLKGVFVSTGNRSLWTTEGWYTLNEIPKDLPGFKNTPAAPIANTLSEKEKADGWKLLFDGKTMNGWRNFKSDKIGSAWKVKDGTITLDNSKKKDWQVVGGGDIVTNDEYENYELSLEWKIQKCGNSGVIFNVVEDAKYDYVWQTGPEMQVLDNVCHPDGRIEKHRAGDLYDLIETKFVAANQAGEWNLARLVSNKGNYEFWLNGYKLVEFKMHTPEWDNMIKNSKFKDMPDFGKATKGRIALQDHGDQVWFRNIKIREIK